MPRYTILVCDTCGYTVRLAKGEETLLFWEESQDGKDCLVCWQCASDEEVAGDDENSEE